MVHVLTSNGRRGAEVFGVALADVLSSRGWSGDVIALAPAPAPDGAMDVRTLGPRPLGGRALRALRRALRGCDVVVAHGSRTLPAVALSVSGLGVPFVYRNIGDPAHWSSTPVRRARSRALLRRATRVAALTPTSARVLRSTFGVRPERVAVIPNGVCSARFPPVQPAERAAARRRFGLAETAPVVVSIGALAPEKQVDVMIEAVGRLPAVHLLVAGTGPQGADLTSTGDRLAPGRVHMLGATDDPAATLAAADVVALSSRTEGLPAVLIEAGMRGLPVVATDVGLVRDIVVDGETGHLVPPGDAEALAEALRLTLARPGRLGANARTHCRARFDLEDVADRWDRLLDDVVAGR